MPSTVIRMLLNHFRWDKEKLMERYYDGDPEKLFTEAHVASPFAKPSVSSKIAKRDSRRPGPSVEECEVDINAFCILLKRVTSIHFNQNFHLDLPIYLTFVCDVWVGMWASFLCLLLGRVPNHEDHVGRDRSNYIMRCSQLWNSYWWCYCYEARTWR